MNDDVYFKKILNSKAKYRVRCPSGCTLQRFSSNWLRTLWLMLALQTTKDERAVTEFKYLTASRSSEN